ncbi:MAG: 2-iminoacetate synthase ThiH [Peptostreptococcaceae bacterium]|nr:2-iminoacetate synthase ThiH [Peptostreptococcaceae bacterium]
METTAVMEYQPAMEQIDSDIMDRVLQGMSAFNAKIHTGEQVRRALAKEKLSLSDLEILLSPAAEKYLEQMALRSRYETRKHFGNSVAMFTPLYIANYCDNHCTYCGFNCKNKIRRGKLSFSEMEREMENIARSGLEELLLLTGESRRVSDVEYIGEAIRLAGRYFSTVGIEIYPLNTSEYRYLNECGAEFVSVYQESYDPQVYDRNHPSGPKRSFPYRFHAQERALLGGMRGVAFGSLLGLGDFRRDAYTAAFHAMLIQRKYPHAELSFSFPRLRPYINGKEDRGNLVHEKQLLQIMTAYRLFMPFAGITISTRERAGFRDNVVGIAATKISSGVSVGVGGHEEEAKGDEQFQISDPRTTEEVRRALMEKGLQPVFTDHIRLKGKQVI